MSLPPGWTALHASAVAHDGRAVLVFGASGAGKSGLALQLIALGAVLVSDDQVLVRRDGDHVMLAVPEPLQGKIEARGVGLLTIPYISPVKALIAVDLELSPDARLPQPRTRSVEGLDLPLICGKSVPNLAQVLWIMLQRSTMETTTTGKCLTQPTDPATGSARKSSS